MFSDADLIAKLTTTEDAFVERKSKGDKGGWLRTTVAFANSTPVDYPALLFVGVANDGTIAENLKTEDLMKSFSDYISEHSWPPIYTAPCVVTHAGRSCIAVIIPGSENRPHFAGRSYVREGTQTKDASDRQFQQLIAERSSKTRKLLDSKGKQVTLETLRMRGTPHTTSNVGYWILDDCNEFFVKLRSPRPDGSDPRALPLELLYISHDTKNNQLKIVTEE